MVLAGFLSGKSLADTLATRVFKLHLRIDYSGLTEGRPTLRFAHAFAMKNHSLFG
jgi:hypothetical protein